MVKRTAVRDEIGAGFVQNLVLVGTLGLGTAGAFTAMGGEVGSKARCVGRAVASLTGLVEPCSDGAPALAATPVVAPVELAAQDPDEPVLEDAPPLVALPFPGRVAVTGCTGYPSCDSVPGVRVQATVELALARSQTELDDTGCPHQSLSMSARIQTDFIGGAEARTRAGRVGGEMSVFEGRSFTYTVTVPPDAADAIARGERRPPNPVDPRTIAPGESVVMSAEFFNGHNLQVSYRALQASMGFEEGRRLSAGAERIDPRTVRIYVGDEQFVRTAMSLGIGFDGASFAITADGGELSTGELRAVDIDIGTQEGWDAYQRFVADGELPPRNAPGTSNPVFIESRDVAQAGPGFRGQVGPLALDAALGGTSEGHVTHIRQNGTLERVTSGRHNEMGFVVREQRPFPGLADAPSPPPTRSYSLVMEGVDSATIEAFESDTGQSLAGAEDGNVRFDFSEADLRAIQAQAFDQVLYEAEQNGIELSRAELERLLREDPGHPSLAAINEADDLAFEIARAQSPDEVLVLLYNLGRGDGTRGLQGLLDFVNATTFARHGVGSRPLDHPDSLLPGTHVVPDCG
jgi:hypothetical protein